LKLKLNLLLLTCAQIICAKVLSFEEKIDKVGIVSRW